MRVEKLFEIICPEAYKTVNLEVMGLLNIEDLNGKSPMVFSVLGDEERELYNKVADKSSFLGSSESIKIYNIEVEAYYLILKETDASGLHDIMMKKLRKYCNLVPVAYLYLTHMLLHESGHYQQYIDRERNVFLYTTWCEEEERSNFNEQQKVYIQMQSRIAKSILSVGVNKSEKIILERLSREYRKIPKEYEADSFAYKHMEQSIDNLIIYFKKGKDKSDIAG